RAFDGGAIAHVAELEIGLDAEHETANVGTVANVPATEPAVDGKITARKRLMSLVERQLLTDADGVPGDVTEARIAPGMTDVAADIEAGPVVTRWRGIVILQRSAEIRRGRGRSKPHASQGAYDWCQSHDKPPPRRCFAVLCGAVGCYTL